MLAIIIFILNQVGKAGLELPWKPHSCEQSRICVQGKIAIFSLCHTWVFRQIRHSFVCSQCIKKWLFCCFKTLTAQAHQIKVVSLLFFRFKFESFFTQQGCGNWIIRYKKKCRHIAVFQIWKLLILSLILSEIFFRMKSTPSLMLQEAEGKSHFKVYSAICARRLWYHHIMCSVVRLPDIGYAALNRGHLISTLFMTLQKFYMKDTKWLFGTLKELMRPCINMQ